MSANNGFPVQRSSYSSSSSSQHTPGTGSNDWSGAAYSPASGMPTPAPATALPMAQYSTLANYDGSYSRSRQSQPTSPAGGAHLSHGHGHGHGHGQGQQLSTGSQSARLQHPHSHPHAHSYPQPPMKPTSNGVPIVPSNVPRSGSGISSSSKLSPAIGPSGSSPTSNSKSHICEICGQTFTRAHDRKRHEQIHTRQPNEGPGCNWCKKTFSRGDALKRHLDHGCDDMPDEVYARRRLAN